MACIVHLHPEQRALLRRLSPSSSVSSLQQTHEVPSLSSPSVRTSRCSIVESRCPLLCSVSRECRFPLPVKVRNSQKRFDSNRIRSRRYVATAGLRGGRARISLLATETEPLMELSQGQSHCFHELPSGLRLEVIVQKKARRDDERGHEKFRKPPLVFVHGSYHAAWCWACWWLPYFSARGHDCYAVSLLGQVRHGWGQIGCLTKSLTDSRSVLRNEFGKNLTEFCFSESRQMLHPWPMVKRFLKKDLIASMQITLSLAAKLFGTSLWLCRKSFFSPDLPDHDLRKYQSLLKQSSRYPMIDLRKLNSLLPMPRPPRGAPPVLVLAAENDFVVDREGSLETAEWYGTAPQVITGSGHDVMLDTAWEAGAASLYSWLEQHAHLQVRPGRD